MIERRIHRVLLFLFVLLLTTLPPTVSATSTHFKGLCEYLEDLSSPDLVEWWTDPNEHHIRNQVQAFRCDFSDDRLDGVYQIVVNWDVSAYYDPFYYVIGRDYGQMTLIDEDGSLLWEGFREYSYSPPRAFRGKMDLQGRGDYAGLTAIADVWGDFLAGPIIQMGGHIYTLAD